MNCSVLNYYGPQKNKCGYCKGATCSISHGMHAFQLLPMDYQDLIDRGWRRSGTYCYKPQNQTTCCPSYTIKCDALKFKLSKSHKKVLKRMNRFLRDGRNEADSNEGDQHPEETAAPVATAASPRATAADSAASGDTGEAVGGSIRDEPQAPNVAIRKIDLAAVNAANSSQKSTAVTERRPHSDAMEIDETSASGNSTAGTSGTAASSGASSGASQGICLKKSYDDDHNLPCKKAKQMRLDRRQDRLAAKGALALALTAGGRRVQATPEKTLSQFIGYPGANDKHKLRIVLVPSNRVPSDEAFLLYRKYQIIVHSDDPQHLTPTSLQRFCYKSPLKPTHTADGPSQGYGSFHQQYWLDDKLIAVGVIDILPYCVSAVYFFYDPDYSFLSLGTYGSLREIELVQQLAAKVPALKYYYMGFYIHSCPKMRYKGKLVPSFLLCPETYVWNLLTDEMRARLDACKYQRLNDDPMATDVNEFADDDLDLVQLLLHNHTKVTYGRHIQSFNIKTLDNMLDIIRSRIYKEVTGEDGERDDILEYAKLVGKPCAVRMLFVKQ